MNKQTRESLNAYYREYRKTHQVQIATNQKRYKRRKRAQSPSYFKEHQRIYNERIKAVVLTHYGNGKLACINCGFTDPRALTIDHINNDRKTDEFFKNRHGGYGFLLHLRKLGYPKDYQTLCANCNLIKEIERLRQKVKCN